MAMRTIEQIRSDIANANERWEARRMPLEPPRIGQSKARRKYVQERAAILKHRQAGRFRSAAWHKPRGEYLKIVAQASLTQALLGIHIGSALPAVCGNVHS